MAREMVDSGQVWLGQIPKGWNIGKIGGLYKLRNTKVSDKDYPALSVTKNGIVPQLETAAKTNDGDNRKLVRIGDFAINSRSDRRGSCGISPYDGSVSLIVTVLEPREEMNPRYYDWLFHTKEFADEFYANGRGIVDDLWTTNWQNMKRISVVVPPLPEQQKIAAFLDDKCAEFDSLIADIQREIDKLERLKRSVIAEAVTKGLDKNAEMKDSGVIWAPVIPKSWKPLKVKYIMFETKTKADTEIAEPLSVTQKYGIIKSSEATVANPSQSYEGYKAVCVDDIVFNKYKAHSGVFFSSTYNGMVTFNYSVYRCYEGNVPKYYEYLFHTDGCIGEFKTKMHGVGESISPLYTKDLFAITVIQPTFAEQRRIVEYLDARCAEFDTILSEKQKQIEILQKLKKSVIYEYVTGKKEVK